MTLHMQKALGLTVNHTPKKKGKGKLIRQCPEEDEEMVSWAENPEGHLGD